MKTTKNRWDSDGYAYVVSAGKAGWIEVGAHRDLNTQKIGDPKINCTATGSLTQEEATHFMLALKHAMKLAKQLRKKVTGT